MVLLRAEACLFFSNDLLRLRPQSVQYDLQHDFVWVTDEADHSLVLALLHIAFLRKCDDFRTGSTGFAILLSARSCCRVSGEL